MLNSITPKSLRTLTFNSVLLENTEISDVTLHENVKFYAVYTSVYCACFNHTMQPTHKANMH